MLSILILRRLRHSSGLVGCWKRGNKVVFLLGGTWDRILAWIKEACQELEGHNRTTTGKPGYSMTGAVQKDSCRPIVRRLLLSSNSLTPR